MISKRKLLPSLSQDHVHLLPNSGDEISIRGLSETLPNDFQIQAHHIGSKTHGNFSHPCEF
jgi:hypothetical protein